MATKDTMTIDATFFNDLKHHMELEETREAQMEEYEAQMRERNELMDQLFRDGKSRMDDIEKDLNAISKVVATVNGFLLSMKFTIGIAAAFLGLFGWVLLEKNSDIKEIQKTLMEHTIQNTEMLTLLKGEMRKNEEQQKRIETNTERILRGTR